jgi:hypothetical protein
MLKSSGLRSGDLSRHDTGLPHPIHLPGNCVEKLLGLCPKLSWCPIMLKPHIMADNQWHTFMQHWYNFSQKCTIHSAIEMVAE